MNGRAPRYHVDALCTAQCQADWATFAAAQRSTATSAIMRALAGSVHCAVTALTGVSQLHAEQGRADLGKVLAQSMLQVDESTDGALLLRMGNGRERQRCLPCALRAEDLQAAHT